MSTITPVIAAARLGPVRMGRAADGPVVIDTCATDSDTTLAVYTGDALDALDALAATDDGFTGQSLGSSVRFVAVEGQTYRIAVDGFEAAEGAFIVSVEPGATPGNDAVASAETSPARTPSRAAATAARPAKRESPTARRLVSAPIRLVPMACPAGGPVFVDTCAASFDATLAVIERHIGEPPDGGHEQQRSDDSSAAVTSAVEFNAAAGDLLHRGGRLRGRIRRLRPRALPELAAA